jgi:hypothetical protein
LRNSETRLPSPARSTKLSVSASPTGVIPGVDVEAPRAIEVTHREDRRERRAGERAVVSMAGIVQRCLAAEKYAFRRT